MHEIDFPENSKRGSRAQEQVEEKFVPLTKLQYWGEAASALKGASVEVLGTRLSDGKTAQRPHLEIGVRITGDLDQLQKLATAAEEWADQEAMRGYLLRRQEDEEKYNRS